jgi:hypothetical protein
MTRSRLDAAASWIMNNETTPLTRAHEIVAACHTDAPYMCVTAGLQRDFAIARLDVQAFSGPATDAGRRFERNPHDLAGHAHARRHG